MQMNLQKISLDEQHHRLLAIATIFDELCTKHNIPYYMLGGTMLGAIRHKGFIPWDDDMDFGVPRPYYSTLVGLLEKNLPEPYRCCYYENNDNAFSPFFKIEDTSTVVYDKRIPLPVEKQMGINVDVFPLDYCDRNCFDAKLATFLCNIYSAVYIDSYDGVEFKNYVKKLLRKLMPYTRIEFLRLMTRKLETMNSSGQLLANIYGRWREKEWVPVEWYGEGVRFLFENIELCGFAEYDKYLKQMYGEYSVLPPKELQVSHADNVFLRK